MQSLRGCKEKDKGSSSKSLRRKNIVKGGTKTTKKHRFESFNQRISKLSIDPIRRRRTRIQDDETTETVSFFRASLDRWKDTNLSENFTSFVHEVNELCNTLPQLLYYKDPISEALLKYIGKADPLSLEPLLDLLSSFARDLGTNFEGYYERAITLVVSVAAEQSDPEAIESSFTCLTWLFKYLSRLLVPDLRPTFYIMAPFLGKTRQKSYIMRFAAEAMSFLLRKAALMYARDERPLRLILEAIQEDLATSAGSGSKHAQLQLGLYNDGLSTLFLNSMKGVDKKLHSCSVCLYRLMLEIALLESDHERAAMLAILSGVTIALIHHTDAVGFQPVLRLIIENIHAPPQGHSDIQLRICGSLLFISSAVRQGSRIHDWDPVLDGAVKLLAHCDRLNASIVVEIYKAVAVTLQYAPFDIVLPRSRTVVKILERKELENHFLPFCNYFCDLGRERFHDLILPAFNNFVISKWRGHELQLCSTVPKMRMMQDPRTLTCSESWQDTIADCFDQVVVRDEMITQCFAYLSLLDHMSYSSITRVKIDRSLHLIIQTALHSSNHNDTRVVFSMGAALQAYVSSPATRLDKLLDLWPLLCDKAPYNSNLLPYLEAMLNILKKLPSEKLGREMDGLVQVAIENLHLTSHLLRKISLEILRTYYEKYYNRPADVLSVAWEIELCPLDLSSTRTISMYIRKMQSSYLAISTHGWLPEAVIHFCFGLLSYRLASVRKDAIVALKQICEDKNGEELVSNVCFTWLEQRYEGSSNEIQEATPPQKGQELTAFQCSNLIKVENLIIENSRQVTDAEESLLSSFEAVHQRHGQQIASAPHLALQVFAAVPSIAEKRSRRFVPIFLSSCQDELIETAHDEVEDATSSQISNEQPEALARWSFRDRKAMLDLFGSFHNPAALYRSSEVFDALKNLLTNGDLDIQRAALKGLLTWKLKDIGRYQEHLLNLLDEKRFRDELSIFLQVDNQDSTIEAHHRRALMPILLRLLYGRLVARSGVKSGNSGQPARRKAVFQALSRLDDEYLSMFVSIALGPVNNMKLSDSSHSSLLQENETSIDGRLTEHLLAGEKLSVRKQVGLMNMIKDLLGVLGSRLSICTSAIANAVFYCSIRSSRQFRHDGGHLEKNELESRQTSLHKSIRQIGLQCLILLFKSCPHQQLEAFSYLIFNEIVGPRLDHLPIETAQSISGILSFFSVLASSDETLSMLCQHDAEHRGLHAVVNCLGVPSARDEVKLYVMNEILKKIVSLAGTQQLDRSITGHNVGFFARKVLRPALSPILDRVGALLKGSPSKDVLASAIELVSMLGPLVEGSCEVHDLLEISTFLLEQPPQRVSPKSKGSLLTIIKYFLQLQGSEVTAMMLDHIYRSTASLFGYFKDRPNRLAVSEVMIVLATKNQDLRQTAELCASLNSFSASRLDEPDFNRRLKAFAIINEQEFRHLSPKQWRPLLYNMLYFIKDDEELAIRTNAGFSLRRFIDTNVVNVEDTSLETYELVKHVLLPALRNGASAPSELVRSEYLSVMAHLIKSNQLWDEVNDMAALLVEADEEASFFGNILHIQQHRRLRALRRLAAQAHQNRLRSINVAHYFIPLIEHYIFNKADDESAHNLSAETIKTIGILASSLEWPQFRAVFRRYSGYIQSKPDLEKAVIRLLGVVVDALVTADEVKRDRVDPVASFDPELPNESISARIPSMLSKTMPEQEKLADDLLSNLLPSLTRYIHEKDESTVSLRIPVAISVVKMLKLLPNEKFRDRLPPVLTDLCHILRSRAQESRDLTRRTLTEISTLIGPRYFSFVLKELRNALARGYQLHVLSFTVHSILTATSDIFKPGDLDYCLSQIVAIIMDDIFGATGQEKDAEDYISKMKEVKGSKSYDSMELIAKTVTIENLAQLINPVHELLKEKLDLRTMRRLDELLRRIGLGLMRNACIEDHRVLVFAYEIIREAYKGSGPPKAMNRKDEHIQKKYLIQAHAQRAGNRGTTSSYSFKLVRFALDILRAVLQKFNSLRTPSNLEGFIPILGDALIQTNEEIQTSGLRLLAAIIKVPLRSIDENAALYIAECVKIVKSSTSTNTEIAQAALKLISAILRERRTVEIREPDLAYLLRRLTPDLEEPDKQGVAFNFLKAVMSRSIVVTEFYEIMDLVAVVMVTNQTKGARDMARSVYFQFVMEYPQSKDRFAKQSSFLIKNLDFEYPEGRRSVMEAIHLLLNKVKEDLIQNMIGNFFVPLVMVIVNDGSTDCREMAGALLRSCFGRADRARTQSALSLLHAWLDRSDQPLLVRVALQVSGIYLEVKGADAEKDVPSLQTRISRILRSNLKDPVTANWEIIYCSLQSFSKICGLFPASSFASTAGSLWQSVRQCLAFPHAWIKLASAKLLGKYYADFARINAQEQTTTLPLIGSGGLHLSGQEIVEVTRASLSALKVPTVSEELAAQSVRNLVFLAKIASQTSLVWPTSPSHHNFATELLEEDEYEDEDEHDREVLTSASPSQPTSLLSHLLMSAAYTLRLPPPIHATSSTRNPTMSHNSLLLLLTHLLNTLSLPHLQPSLPKILISLNNLTDSTSTMPSSYAFSNPALKESFSALTGKATEAMELVAKRIGVTEYAKLMAEVKEQVRERREERRGKRRGLGVAGGVRPERKKRKKGLEGQKRKGLGLV